MPTQLFIHLKRFKPNRQKGKLVEESLTRAKISDTNAHLALRYFICTNVKNSRAMVVHPTNTSIAYTTVMTKWRLERLALTTHAKW